MFVYQILALTNTADGTKRETGNTGACSLACDTHEHVFVVPPQGLTS